MCRSLWEEMGHSQPEGLEKGYTQDCVSFTYIFYFYRWLWSMIWFSFFLGINDLIYLCHYIFVFIKFSYLRRVYSFLGYMTSISLFSIHILVYNLWCFILCLYVMESSSSCLEWTSIDSFFFCIQQSLQQYWVIWHICKQNKAQFFKFNNLFNNVVPCLVCVWVRLLVCLFLNFSCPLRISNSSSDFRVNLLFLLMIHWKLQPTSNFLIVVVILVAELEFGSKYFFTLGCCSLIFREQRKKLSILEMELATTR